MRAEIVAAERARQVRDAARAWLRAGFVSEALLSRSVSLYPDDRRRFGLGFRTLAFIFTGLAVCTLVGLSLALFRPSGASGFGVHLCVWAGILCALTEFQHGPLRRVDAGAESATACASVAFGVGGIVSLSSAVLDHASFQQVLVLFLASTCALCLLACWRWGDRIFFACAALSGFGLLGQTAHGRLLWIMASLILIPRCLFAARDPRLSPPHRTGAVILGAVSILALYGALHIWSFDQRLIESMHASVGASLPFRSLSIAATALLPPALLVIGWRRREPLLLYAGLVLVFASIATIRLYRAVMPLSFALILIGTACLALALGIRRWLRSGDGAERSGFTADPLLDNTSRTEAIRSVVAMASFTPATQTASPQGGFEGGGGRSGGAGASGDF